MRTKTKRRLTILLGVTVLLAALLGGTYFVLDTRRAQVHEAHREQGLEAFEQQQYLQALHHLGMYLNNIEGEDTQVRYKYAVSRLNVPEDGRQHIADAVAHFRHLLELEPGHRAAREHLLDAYVEIGWSTEALETAQYMLEREPEHRQALRARAIATARLGDEEAALGHVRQYLEHEPADVEMFAAKLHLMQRRGAVTDEVLEAAENHVARIEPEQEAMAALLRGLSHRMVQQWSPAVQWYSQAAERAPTDDASFVRTLTRELVATNQAETALELLERAHEQTQDPRLHLMLVQRLWETGQAERMLERIDTAATETDEDVAELLVYRILGLWQLQQRERVPALVQELGELEHTPVARVWLPVLAVIQDEGPGQAETLRTLRQAASQRPNDARLHFLLGRAYAGVGEPELARRSWRAASEQAPGWALPHLALAESLAEQDDSEAATEAAIAAMIHGPGRLDTAVSAVVARAAGLDPSDTEMAGRLLDAIERIQEIAPNEPRTRRVQVMLHLQMNEPAQARQVVQQAIDGEPPLPEQELLVLAEMTQQAGLNVAEDLLQASERAHGVTPRLIAARAGMLARQGRRDEARALLEQAVADAADDDRLAWQIARLQFLDGLGRGDAGDWAELLARHGDSATLLRAALASLAVRTDRQLMEQMIRRLRELTGDSGVTWRLAQARFFLTSAHAERDAAQAASLLSQLVRDEPEHTEARVLLAQALLRLENPRRAIEQLDTAVAIEPENPQLRLHLAQLHQSQGQFDEARVHLRHVADSATTARQHRRQAALMLSQQAEHEHASQVLAQLAGGDEAADADMERLALATLYERQGRLDEAWETIHAALESGRAPAPGLLLFASRLAHRRGDDEAGQRLFERLDELEMPELARHLARADFHGGRGELEQAIAQASAAADLAPDHPAPWRQLVLYYMSTGRVDQALEQARLGRQHVTEPDPMLDLIHEHRELFAVLQRRTGLAPIVRAALQDAGHREAALGVLRIARRVEDGQMTDRQAVRAMVELADEHPRFGVLQRFAIEQATILGHPYNALDRARDALHRFPGDARIAELAAKLLLAVGEHDEALAAAAQWRQRVGARTLEPDLFEASVERHRGRRDAVLELLAPHRERATADPQRHGRWYEHTVWALLDRREYDAAASLLEPLLGTEARWRALWRDMAEHEIDDPDVVVQWLNRLEPLVPAEAVIEQIALAGAWQGAGQRLGRSTFVREARQRLDRIVRRYEDEAMAHFARGVVAEVEGEPAVAERYYRRALELAPDSPVIANNLAMVLAETGQALDEARQMMAQVLEQAPDVATFHDTLAFVQMQAQRWDEALAAIDRAIELEPESDDWRVARAYILHRAGRADEARDALLAVERRLMDEAELSQRSRERLEALRGELEAGLSLGEAG